MLRRVQPGHTGQRDHGMGGNGCQCIFKKPLLVPVLLDPGEQPPFCAEPGNSLGKKCSLLSQHDDSVHSGPPFRHGCLDPVYGSARHLQDGWHESPDYGTNWPCMPAPGVAAV